MATLDQTPSSQLGSADYRLLIENSPLPIWVYDVKTLRVLEVNASALALYGHDRDAFLRLSLTDLQSADGLAALREHFEPHLIRRTAQRRWHRHRGGAVIDVEILEQDLMLGGIQARLVTALDESVRADPENVRREMTERFTTVLESMTDAFFMVDRDTRFTYINGQAEKVLQRSRDELLGCKVWDKFPQAAGSIYQVEYERAISERCTRHFEALDGGGLNRWLSVTCYPLEAGLAVYFRDITAKHENEQRMARERRVLDAVINATGDAIVATGIDGLIRMFNPGAERIFGRTRQSMLGEPVNLLMPEGFRAAHAQRLRSFYESGHAVLSLGMGRRVKGLRADGQELELEATASRVEQGGETLLIACLRDVTERVRLDAAVEQSRRQLSELTRRLMTQERALVKGMAQALHDNLGQTLAAIRMAHETVMTMQASQLAVMPTEIGRVQVQMGTLIGQAIAEVRQVLVDLRPPLLEEKGFIAALDNELMKRSLVLPAVDISFHVASETAGARWPAEVEHAAFMVAREAVENALRHSKSNSVSVRLSGTAGSLRLEVADRGVGVLAAPNDTSRHLGILGMHERAQAIGAVVALDAVEPHGTRVSFNWSPAP